MDAWHEKKNMRQAVITNRLPAHMKDE